MWKAESQNHKMAQVRRDLKDHQAPNPLLQAEPPAATFNTRPAVQGPIQPGLELLKGWTGHPQPLWAAVPAPHHSQSEEHPPDIQSKPSLLDLKEEEPMK